MKIDGKANEFSASAKPDSRMGRPPKGATSRRDVILDVALPLLIARGLGGITMNDVAVSAGASKTTLYKLFPNTGALFTAALARQVERRRGTIMTALEAPDLAKALSSIAYAMLDALDDEAVELFRLVISEAGRRPELGQTFYIELVETVAKPIGKLLEKHLCVSPQTALSLALQFVGAIKEPLFYPRLMSVPVSKDSASIVERAVDMVLDYNRHSDAKNSR